VFEVNGEPQKKHSYLSIGAFSTAVAAWFYYAVLLISRGRIESILAGMECSRQDFGACALQNLFSIGLELILLFIVFVVIPGFLILMSAVLGGLAFIPKDRKRILAVVAIILDVTLVLVVGCVIFVNWPGSQ